MLRAPVIEANNVLNSLILQGADVGVPNSMHMRVSADQRTYLAQKDLKIKRGKKTKQAGVDRRYTIDQW